MPVPNAQNLNPVGGHPPVKISATIIFFRAHKSNVRFLRFLPVYLSILPKIRLLVIFYASRAVLSEFFQIFPRTVCFFRGLIWMMQVNDSCSTAREVRYTLKRLQKVPILGNSWPWEVRNFLSWYTRGWPKRYSACFLPREILRFNSSHVMWIFSIWFGTVEIFTIHAYLHIHTFSSHPNVKHKRLNKGI